MRHTDVRRAQMRRRTGLPRLFSLLLVLSLLFVVALASAVITMHFAIHGAEVTVPDLHGMSEGAARRKTAALNLTLNVDDRYYSTNVPAGALITQSPAPGVFVRRDWAVRVTESLGPQTVGVPSVIGQTEQLAIIGVRRLGLHLGTVARIPDAAAASDTVIAQTPAPGAAKVERPDVSLLLSAAASSTGSASTGSAFVMPNLVHGGYTAATTAIARAGLKLAPPVYQDKPQQQTSSAGEQPYVTNTVSPSTVLAQKPLPGQRVDASIPIELTVAR